MTDATWSSVCIPAILVCLAVFIVAVKMQQRKDREFHAATSKRFDYAPGKINYQPVVTSIEDGPAWGRGNPQLERTRWNPMVTLSDEERATLERVGRTGSPTPLFDLLSERKTQTDQGALPDMHIARDARDETRTAPAPQVDPFPEPPKPKLLPYIPLEPHTGETQTVKTTRKNELPWLELPKDD